MKPTHHTLKHIFVTGMPGVGKTTLMKKLLQHLSGLQPIGFYTEEIREKGTRKGFKLLSPDGTERILAHVHIKSSVRVGKYGVDIAGFEAFLDAIRLDKKDASLVIIDEIGKMECHSKKFRDMVIKLLRSDKTIIATIAMKGGGLVADIKKRADIDLMVLTQLNREAIFTVIVNTLSRRRFFDECVTLIPPRKGG
ncbi:MAG: NTPase [Deltaproteobacteria bacterium]|nr:NTPase [Deltaproteobacteria bacterium]MBW1993981.1 NTPase [Deltaproteobacteria bacterium]